MAVEISKEFKDDAQSTKEAIESIVKAVAPEMVVTATPWTMSLRQASFLLAYNRLTGAGDATNQVLVRKITFKRGVKGEEVGLLIGEAIQYFKRGVA